MPILGDSPTQMIFSLLTRPNLVWAQLMAADAGGYLWSLLWPTAFLASACARSAALGIALAGNQFAGRFSAHARNAHADLCRAHCARCAGGGGDGLGALHGVGEAHVIDSCAKS